MSPPTQPPHRRLSRRSLRAALIAPLLAGGLTAAGCRTPAWCTLGHLRCLPAADQTAPLYWSDCGPRLPENAGNPSEPQLPPAGEPSASADDAPHVPKFLLTAAQLPHAGKPVSRLQLEDGSPSDLELPEEIAAAPELQNPFQLPPVLPGAETPPLVLPPPPLDGTGGERAAAIERLYDPAPELRSVPAASPDAALGLLGLDQLQTLARENNPRLREAAAAVEAARGEMIQAGLPPNPQVGYQADTVGTVDSNGYQGAYFEQTIITARKLGLAAEARAVEYANASLRLERTWYDVVTEVRRAYFDVLAARQRLRLAGGLYELSRRSYQTQIDLVRVGEAAPYEPLQLRVLTTQARVAVVQAQQESLAAWRSLAAATGVPGLQPAALLGRIDCPVPAIEYEAAAARLVAVHAELRIARNEIARRRTLIELADRQPIPDLDVEFVTQRDYTFDPGATTYNLRLGGAVPVWDRNQGNRVAARANLVQASEDIADTRNRLIADLAEAYGRYAANREIAGEFRGDALADQVRTYRGVYQRYANDPEGVSFNDVVVAQQTLAQTLNQYLDILRSQWQATVDVAGLLQVDDLFQMGPPAPMAEFPEVVDETSAAGP